MIYRFVAEGSGKDNKYILSFFSSIMHGRFHYILLFLAALVSCYGLSVLDPQTPRHLPETPLKNVPRFGCATQKITIVSNDEFVCTTRRPFIQSIGFLASLCISSAPATAVLTNEAELDTGLPVDVSVTGEIKKLFNEGRALESQGNIAAAQRLYEKVTQIAPRFIYGWSNLGNTQTAFGDLNAAEKSYDIAIDLCNESSQQSSEEGFGVRRCSDMYVLLLNRGSLRLNNGRPKEALNDLQESERLRGRPDAIVLQNLARALEINGMYSQADNDYTTAISMTANEVNPFWLRSALVKFQLGDVKGGFDLFKRVENRFPEAPEVRAAYAVFLAERGDLVAGQQKFLEIPDRQRLKYVGKDYLTKTISWPPAMIDTLGKITRAVGDDKKL
jgi:Tetratricopeptide repeat